ncbi:MAG: DUF362 domain-containing protein [Candidatus Latescibacteria bacterium]|nr:DUF362 domain-containing protein [bacterium]MBD3423046.1 DUF362 domain-containing protein [Candidatus Latescibacterota bacterium]
MTKKITRREFIAATGSFAVAMALPRITFGKDAASEVFYTGDISSEGILRVFDRIKDRVSGKVAIKMHFGEEGNKYYIKPELVKELARKLDATLIETNVLYVSKWRNEKDTHIQLARKHGFDFAPIDIIDAEGEIEIPAEGKHYQKVYAGANINEYDTIIYLSHFKGHGMAGFGGAIKNVSMGMASVHGKMALHASAVPNYDGSKCIRCEMCVGNCPGEAITIRPVKIDPEKCIGCGSCISICPTQVFDVPWRSTSQNIFMERLAEYARAVCYGRNSLFINVAADISRDCDCAGWARKPFMEDVGVFASTDLVAVEKASLDLVNKTYGVDDAFLKVNSVSGAPQIDFAHSLGLGNMKYKLIDTG